MLLFLQMFAILPPSSSIFSALQIPILLKCIPPIFNYQVLVFKRGIIHLLSKKVSKTVKKCEFKHFSTFTPVFFIYKHSLWVYFVSKIVQINLRAQLLCFILTSVCFLVIFSNLIDFYATFFIFFRRPTQYYPNYWSTYCIRVYYLWPTINFQYLDMISHRYIPKKY